MGKSLRDEVEAFIASDLVGACEPEYGIVYEKLRDLLDRHPPADGVVVSRDLLTRLTEYARELGTDHMDDIDDQALIEEFTAQADALLATKAGP